MFHQSDQQPSRWSYESFNCLVESILWRTAPLLPPPALLPPHMKPAANSLPLLSPNATGQTFTYDLPKDEPDLNTQSWDPNYSYTLPEGTGVQVKLPAGNSGVTAQTIGKWMNDSFFSAFWSWYTAFSFSLFINFFGNPRLFCTALKPQRHLFLQDLPSWSQCQNTWFCYPHPHRLFHLKNQIQTRHVSHHLLVNVTLTLSPTFERMHTL